MGGQCDAQWVIGTLTQAVRLGTPVALAAYCGVMCERSGVINIGIEGMMLMAAMVGYGVNLYAFLWLKDQGTDPASAGNMARWIALVMGVASAALLALLHCL